ncbi:MAG: winged helix-turn-helix domain-containing protein [Acidobacteria bacterium]|nr:winged helix-turn-helix domain-containing protein [Acidobacteriota bacterium]
MSEEIRRVYEFGHFRLDVEECALWRDGEKIALTQKALELLLILVEHDGRLVTKAELVEALWPDTYVDENNLAVTVSMLRKAFGEKAGAGQFIETVPKRGYRFVAPVTKITPGSGDLIVERHARTVITVEEEEPPKELEGDAGADVRKSLAGETQAKSIWRRRALPLGLLLLVLTLAGALAYVLWKAKRQRDSAAAANAAQPTATASPIHSIAILPLKTIGAVQPGDEYLGIGMADALITRLGSVRQLAVRSTSAIMRYANSPPEPRAAGRELGVDAVLEGSLQHEGDRLRLTMQLVEVSDGATIWTGQFDEHLTGLFELQDSISGQVAAALLPHISSEQRELLARHETDDREAYKLYLKGRYHWNKRTPESLQESIRLLDEAIARDPLYALAYAGLADSFVLLSEYGVAPPADTFPRAKVAAGRALQLEPDLAEAHTTLAYVFASYDWNFAEAEREYLRALELNPNYATAHQWYGELLCGLKRFDESERELNRAVSLDPLSAVTQMDVGLLLFYRRDFDAAISQFQKTAQSFPDFPSTRMALSLVYERVGNLDGAAAALIEFVRLLGADEKAVGSLRELYKQQGYQALLKTLLAGADTEARRHYVPPFTRAAFYTRLKDRENALLWLGKAYAERFRYVTYIGGDPTFDFLRDDARFQELLKRVGLP